jgi:multidrug transporter EmrE-like cation transporter
MTRPLPVVGVVGFYLSTFTLMSVCLKHLEVGTVYAVWSGAGTALVAMIGILYFGENFTWLKILGLSLVIAGVFLLHQASS